MGDRLSRLSSTTETPEAAAAPATVAKITRYFISMMTKFDLVRAVELDDVFGMCSKGFERNERKVIRERAAKIRMLRWLVSIR